MTVRTLRASGGGADSARANRLPDATAGEIRDTAAAGEAAPPADALQTFCDDLLSDTRAELTRADTKAQLLLAAVGVAAGALLGGLISAKWDPTTLDNRVEWLWWAGVAAAACGVAALGAAVYPRIRARRVHQASTVISYFGDVVTHSDPAGLRTALETSAVIPSVRAVDQLIQVSRIVVAKYRLIRAGMWLLAAAGLSTAIATLISGTAMA